MDLLSSKLHVLESDLRPLVTGQDINLELKGNVPTVASTLREPAVFLLSSMTFSFETNGPPFPPQAKVAKHGKVAGEGNPQLLSVGGYHFYGFPCCVHERNSE